MLRSPRSLKPLAALLLFAAVEPCLALPHGDADARTAAPHLGRRRQNYTQHPPETMEYLKHFNHYVPLYFWLGLIGMIAVASIANWVQRVQGHWRRRHAGFRHEGKRLPRVKTHASGDLPTVHHMSPRYGWYWLSSFWRKYSIKHNGIAEAVSLGNVGQLFLIFVYLLLNFLLIFLGTEGDIDWQAHHAARLTYANIPLVIGLAGKNNVLSKLTGFAYESLNVLHRWAARFIIVSSAIHIGGRIHVNVPSASPTAPGSAYIGWGWAGFACFLLMITMASRPIRNRAYQTFLILHVTLWFFIVASLVIHRPQDQGWIWAGFALHGLDRIARGARIFYYHVLKRTEEKDDVPRATVKILSKDTIKVSVRTSQNWIPAQHVYLHCPKESAGGHPFTVSNISRPLEQTDNKRPAESTQELIIRVREGLTRKIFEHASGHTDDDCGAEGASEKWGVEVPLKAWTEGPYGHEKYLGEDYSTLVLVSGGSGVSYALSNALDIVRRRRAMHLGHATHGIPIATERLSFIWMVKSADQVEWIGDHLRDMCRAAPPGLLEITIHITGKRKAGEPAVLEGFVTDDQRNPPPAADDGAGAREKAGSGGDAAEGKEKRVETDRRSSGATAVVTHGSKVVLKGGRPDFKQIVEDEIAQTDYDEWLAIGSCGPTPMNDSLSDAVSLAVQPAQVLRGEVRRNVYLTIEEFGW